MAAPAEQELSAPDLARKTHAFTGSTGRAVIVESALLSILVCSGVFLLQWRYGFNWSDEGWLWYISQRTALGQIPIRDFFSYDPGRYYWSAFFFKLLRGNGLFEQLMANAAFGALGLATIYFAMARMQVRRAWRVAVLLALAIMLGFPRHKTYEQSLSLICAAGIAFVMAKPVAWKRWFAFGVATGIAAFIGRNSGLYFAAATLLLFLLLKFTGEQFAGVRTLLACAAGVIVGYSPMILMLCFVHGLASPFFQSVLFAPHQQLGLPIPFPWHVHVKGLSFADALQARAVSILCIVVPAAYLFAIWKWKGKTGDSYLRLACAASLAGLPYLHHAFSRADFFHIAQGIVPFAVVASALGVYLWQTERRRVSLAFSFTALALIFAAWLPYEPVIQYLRKPGSFEPIAIADKHFYVGANQAAVMKAVSSAFHQCGSVNGSFLAAPYYPGLYAFLNTKAPFWDLYQLWPRDDEFQLNEINLLKQNNLSLVLLNREATMDGIEALKIDRTYPKLVAYITETFERSELQLPDDFELYYSPRSCNSSLSEK